MRASEAARNRGLQNGRIADFPRPVAATGVSAVKVPVLSKTTAVILPAFSRATPSRIKMPRRAAALAPAMMAAGVARPIAQGHATIKIAAAMMNPAAAPTGGCAVPEKLRERVVNFARRFRRESPPKSGGDGDGNDGGHEHVAHAVAEALDVGAAGLGALHGGDDVRQRGGFAGGGHAHDKPAIQIDRAGEKFAAGFFVHGHGFAGEHRLVHGGITFNHHAVHRHAVAGFERDKIAGF